MPDEYEQAADRLEQVLRAIARKIADLESPESGFNLHNIEAHARQFSAVAEAHRTLKQIRSGQFYEE